MRSRLTSNIVEVVSEGLREGVVTTLVVEVPSNRIQSTALLLIQTAGLRDLSLGQSSGGDVLPLSPALDSATGEKDQSVSEETKQK